MTTKTRILAAALALVCLGLNAQPSNIVAQWNFNSVSPDSNISTGTTNPSIGSGTASLIGGTTATFVSGDTALDPAGATDNSGWNTVNYPVQGAGNKTAGVRFDVNTVGCHSIAVSWSERLSATASKYVRLQYSTDGTNFIDFSSATAMSAALVFESKSNSLAGIAGVENNPRFAFKVVTEFESTAAGTTNANYVTASGSNYTSAGTIRLDMVTVWAVTNQPGTIVDDTWTDGSRTNTSLPTDTAWFASSASSLTNYAPGSMTGIADTTSSRTWLTYFTTNAGAPVDLAVGETLKVTLSFIPTNVATFASGGTRGLRVGLFNFADGGTRASADGAFVGATAGSGTNVSGYLLNQSFFTAFPVDGPMSLEVRTNLPSGNLMGTLTDYLAVGASGPTGYLNAPGFASGAQYTLELSVARTATSSVDVSTKITGGSLNLFNTATDTNYFDHRFDCFAVRLDRSTNTADSFTFSECKVEVLSPAVPSVTTLPGSSISNSSATLNGLVTPNGLPTTAWFEWGTSISYGGTTAGTSVGSGRSNVVLQAGLISLTYGATYHYRVVGSNSLGVTLGGDRSFVAAWQAENPFVNPGNDTWENPNNWAFGAPTSLQSLFITNDISQTVTISGLTVSNYPATLTASNLTVAGVGSFTTNTLLLAGAGTNTPLHILANLTLQGSAALVVSNSALQVDGLTSVGGSGTALVTLKSGSLQSAAFTLGATSSSLGQMNVEGGTLTVPGILALGAGPTTSTGRVYVTGGVISAGVLGVGNDGTTNGGLGAGIATFSNATVNATTLNLGSTAGGAASMTLLSSALFTVSSNVTIVSGSLAVTNTLYLAGGSLMASNGTVRAGGAGNGLIAISAGTHIFRRLSLGASNSLGDGALSLSGGLLKILETASANYIVIGGGDLDGTGGTVILGDSHNAAMTVNSGSATNIGNLLVGYTPGFTGTFTQNGGKVCVTTNMILGYCPGLGAVGMSVLSGGTLYVTNAAHSAVLDVRNGLFTLNPGATLVVDSLVLTNSCGHFVNNGGTLIQHNPPNLAPALDADGDGNSNAAELAAGTDPLDPSNLPPALTVTYDRQFSTVTISWRSASSGFNLQQSSDLANPSGWSGYVGGPVNDDGITKSVTITPPTGNQFYRLKK